MVHLFRIGSSERLLLLLGFFLLLHAPFLLWNDHLLVQELLRIRLGERLAEGWRLYAQAADDTGPIPALLYGFLGRAGILNLTALRFLGAGLLWQQALWMNQMAQRYQLVSDRNFLIAFFYLAFARMAPETVTLSPVLLAISFFLPALGVLFRMLKDGASADDAMRMGLWTGFASLCYPPAILFLLPLYLSALFFSGMRLNHYLIAAAAALLPLLGVYVFFLFEGGRGDFLYCLLSQFRLQSQLNLIGMKVLLPVASLLLLISFSGWFYSNQQSRVNFHRLGLNIFFFSAITAAGIMFLGNIRSMEVLLLLLPMAAYFMAQLVLHSRSRLLSEVLGMGLLLLFSFLFYLGSAPGKFGQQRWDDVFLAEPPKGFTANFKDRSLLLLSNDFRFYRYNPPATRFYRFYLSRLDRKDSRSYEGLIYWYQCLAEDPPQLIYDPHRLIPDLALHVPEFRRCYRSSFYPDLYELVPGMTFGAGSSQQTNLK